MWAAEDLIVRPASCLEPSIARSPDVESHAHNDVVRYAWAIVDSGGRNIIEGIDVAERAADGRLRRILMFHEPLPTAS